MITVLIGVFTHVPGAVTHFPDYFDETTREVNAGHFDYHPASLLMSAVVLLLFVSLLLSVLGKKTSARIAMILVLYFPMYVIYGNYVVTLRGLHTQSL